MRFTTNTRDPTAEIRFLMNPFRPSIIAATAITEVTPITSPNTVRADRVGNRDRSDLRDSGGGDNRWSEWIHQEPDLGGRVPGVGREAHAVRHTSVSFAGEGAHAPVY